MFNSPLPEPWVLILNPWFLTDFQLRLYGKVFSLPRLQITLSSTRLNSYYATPVASSDLFFTFSSPGGSVQPERHMADSTQGGEWLLKNVIILFYGETNISLKINIDSRQPTFIYQLRFSRGPHDLFYRTFTCWTCLKHLVKLANKYKCISIFWPSSPSVLDKFNK